MIEGMRGHRSWRHFSAYIITPSKFVKTPLIIGEKPRNRKYRSSHQRKQCVCRARRVSIPIGKAVSDGSKTGRRQINRAALTPSINRSNLRGMAAPYAS